MAESRRTGGGRSTVPKHTLFCPECRYDDVIGGEWIVRERAGREIYTCPDCRATVAKRRRRSDPAAADLDHS